MARIVVGPDDFDIGAEFARLAAGRTDIGGIGCFVGIVRGAHGVDGDARPVVAPPVVAMTLEHYPGMTERAIERIAAEASSVSITPDNAATALEQLPYTRAVLSETLRLYPPAFTLVRQAIGSTRLAQE